MVKQTNRVQDTHLYNQGFHDAYYGRPAAPPPHTPSGHLRHYEAGFADGSRARPMLTIITTRTGPARIPNCTGAQAKRMMVDL